MKYLKNFFYFIVGLSTIVGAIIVLYQFFHKEDIEIEIKTIDRTLLTQMPDTKDLSVCFKYQDSIVVNNLWKLRYVISNVGEKTIIAKGDNKNTLMNTLPLFFRDSVKILSISESNNSFSVLHQIINLDTIMLDFKQWKKNEFIDIVVLLENYTDKIPTLLIDEEDIIDCKVITSEFKPTEIKENKKIIDKFPKWIVSILKILLVMIIIPTNIALLVLQIEKVKEEKIENWKKIIKVIYVWLILAFIISLPLLWIF